MAELQALLDRINEEGIKKTDAERQQRLDAARAEAAEIVSAAQTQASKLVAEAEREAASLLSKGRESLQQASRDVLLSLRKQLQERLQIVIKRDVGAVLSSAELAVILKDAIAKFIASHGTSETLSVLVSPEQAAALETSAIGALAKELRALTELTPVPGLSGFKLEVKGTDVQYDFSDAALTEALMVYLNPKLAELLTTRSEHK